VPPEDYDMRVFWAMGLQEAMLLGIKELGDGA
jgi:hypothetical protein